MSDDYGNSLRDSWDPIGYQRTQDLHKKLEKLQRALSVYEKRIEQIKSIDLYGGINQCPEIFVVCDEAMAEVQGILSEEK